MKYPRSKASTTLGDDVLHLLPESARLLVQLIGLPLTVKLINSWGGTTFPVSKNQTRLGQIRFEALAEVVGTDAATILTRHFGGETFAIPRCHAAMLEVRNRDIRREFDRITREHSAIHAAATLARQHGLTDRTIWEILSKADSYDMRQTRQESLF